jgi:transcriptional regulator with GAF, ATPase, and Fis domain
MPKALLLLSSDSTSPLAGLPFHSTAKSVTIGRAEGCDLVLPASHISSRHALIRPSSEGYLLSDLGSTNGTMVLRQDEKLILGPKGLLEILLSHGDEILLGDIDQPVRLKVRIREAAADELLHNTVVAVRSGPQAKIVNQQLSADETVLRTLLHLVETIHSAPGREHILAHVAQAALDLIPGAVDALVVEKDPASHALVALAQAHRKEGISSVPNQKICQRVLSGNEAALLFGQHDISALPAATLIEQGVGSGIAAIMTGQSGTRGVLQINCSPGCFALDERHLDLALVLAHYAAAAIERSDLISRLRAAEQKLRDENVLLRRHAQPQIEMLADSPAMARVRNELFQAASSEVTVLLLGETGTGKEVAARFLHAHSRRCEGLFVPVNCGALTETLLDSELFGHRKGAFTGAVSDRKGIFEMAVGGTVFLDEIGETPQNVQVRLLRVLEESTIKPVGETLERRVDIRIVAATNKELQRLIQEGKFRQDLYYRLKVFPITLPPLRERPEDVAPLARFFIHRVSSRMGKRIGDIDASFIKALAQYSFPGNVRELANEIERALVRSEEGEPLTAALLSEEIAASRMTSPQEPKGFTLASRLAQVEREIIADTLARHGGKKVDAARELGLTRQGLAKKIDRLGL